MRYLGFVLVVLLISACSKQIDTIQDHNNCLPIKPYDTEKLGISVLTIDDIKLIDQCLEFTISYSGCDANHDINLYLNKSNLSLADENLSLTLLDETPELCLSFFKQNYSYDLTKIDALIDSGTEILLTFTGSEKTFLYKKP